MTRVEKRFVKVPVAPEDRDHPLLRANPLGLIPALELEGGAALSGSAVIVAYLDTLHDGAKLIPEAHYLWALQMQELANATTERLVVWSGARRLAPEIANVRIGRAPAQVARALDYFEARVDSLEETPFNVGHIGIAVMLGYLDFRFSGVMAWREGRPRLAAWHDRIGRRESLQATEFFDESIQPRPAPS